MLDQGGGSGLMTGLWTLADVLHDAYDAEIVLLGGVDDSAMCRAIRERMRTKPLDLSGTTTLRESMAVLAELDLVISNVTGPMHLAVALSHPKGHWVVRGR